MTRPFFRWFRDISIAKKLYFTVGIMALLIAIELVVLFFSINTLSSVRAYVGGEGLYSKAQKDGIYYLLKYARTHNEADYAKFQKKMLVNLGDHKARMELSKPEPNLDSVRLYFGEGRNHSDDIDGMIKLFRRFHSNAYIHRAIVAWTKADESVTEFRDLANRLHTEINSPTGSRERVNTILDEIGTLANNFNSMADELEKLEQENKEVNNSLEKKVRLRTTEIESKNQELEQFAYVASHDLQEPLRTISGFVDLLKKEYRDKLDGNGQIYLNYLSQASDRMKTLIKDLLDYSRIGRAKEAKPVDCNELLDEVLADLGKSIRESGARITSGRLPTLRAYPTELKLLFQNLIANSIKFRHPERIPEVAVSAIQENGKWQFAVSDNGIGIEKQSLDRIFIIFQRLHTRTQYEGSGIGLAHCKKIVEFHEGNIWADAEPGKGSRFFFTISKEL